MNVERHTVRGAGEDDSALRDIRPRWLGMALPPLAWIVQVAVNYAITPWLCRWDNGPLLQQGVSVIALFAAGVGIVLCWQEWRRHGGGSLLHAGADRVDRPRFMALLGLLFGALLFLLILLQGIPPFVVPPCE
jgi:hypothetical protein